MKSSRLFATLSLATIAGLAVVSSRPDLVSAQAPGSTPGADMTTPPTSMGSNTLPGQDIPADTAHALVMAAVEQAKTMDLKMNIAVVDAGGNLKAFLRMDGAWLGSIDIAVKKAKTARYFDMPTGELGKLSQPGGPLYQIEVSNGGLITFPGGIPLRTQDGVVVGAIGVSGSTVDNDHKVAEAGVAAFMK